MAKHISVDGYTDLTEVGRGGSATVFRATDASGQTVAIKVLSGIWNDADQRRFEREKDAMSILDGVDAIVPLLDSATLDDGTPYLVTPYYSNGSLQDHLNNDGPFTLSAAVAIATQVGETLTNVHDRNIFHRDLKPGNLLVDENNKIWLADFGITQINDGRSLSTTAVYTPGYCPPEAFRAGRQNADGTSIDLYGLAATLWALLAGHQPFHGHQNGDTTTDPLVVMNRVNSEPIGLPSPETPETISQVISTATAKDPQFRYKTVAEFVEQLHSPKPKVFESETVSRSRDFAPLTETSNISDTAETVPLYKNRKVVASAAAVLALGLLGVAISFAGLNREGTAAETAATPTTVAALSTVATVQPLAPPLHLTTTTTRPPTTTTETSDTLAPPTDGELQTQIQALMPPGVTVNVTNGVANLSGTVQPGTNIKLLEEQARAVPGIVAVTLQFLLPPVSATRPASTTTRPPATTTTRPPAVSTRPAVVASAPNIRQLDVSLSGNVATITYSVKCDGNFTMSLQEYELLPPGMAGPPRRTNNLTKVRWCGAGVSDFSYRYVQSTSYRYIFKATNNVGSDSDERVAQR